MDGDWKRSVGFTINYESGQSSEDEFPGDVVVRRQRPLVRSAELLEDGGDGAPADLFGTTPPRTIKRDKEKRRACIDASAATNAPRTWKSGILRRKTVDAFYNSGQPYNETPERVKKRASLKLSRAHDRDWKVSQFRDTRADSLPSPGEMPALPTLVESCNRFMCLTSKLKCVEENEGDRPDNVAEAELPQSRVDFHRTFSMLINMGNVEKGCRRTISREEQVWQNELKDLIWLEIQAKLAGRTLEQQDEYLCTQRKIVPIVIKNIVDYRFVKTITCEFSSTPEVKSELTTEGTDEEWFPSECVSFTCEICADNVGRALKEVSTLLDSLYNAVTLYPSWKAMTHDHPLIATHLFKNRLKAMCLWYNVVMHLRLKLLAVKRLIRTMKQKEQDKYATSDGYGSESESRNPQIRFEVPSSMSASSSNNSDASAAGLQRTVRETNELHDSAAVNKKQHPPEVVISDTGGGTVDTTVSYESGYASERDGATAQTETGDNVFNMGPLHDIASMRLLNNEQVSPYRSYHLEVLKTQGVRRSMMFIDKLRNSTLRKVHMTFEKPDQCWEEYCGEEDGGEVFDETARDADENPHLSKEAYELRRYGCQSTECVAMRLPCYRPHFLLLSTICLEAIHDYLALRRETRPVNPSCLTVKQIIHELKEGLDIAADMRALYVRDIKVTKSNAEHLKLVLKEFENTLHKELQQYFAYLMTMSEVEFVSRTRLEKEWTFTTKLAHRVKHAAVLAPDSFTDIVCNQLNRQLKQFQDKFSDLSKNAFEIPDEKDPEVTRLAVYVMCREAQSLYSNEREPCLQTAHFARTTASRLSKATHGFHEHTDRIFKALMSIRDCISSQIKEMSKRVEHSTLEEFGKDLSEGLQTRTRELLLQVYRFGFELHKELYKFVHTPMTSRVKDAPKQRPASLQPIRRQAVDERPKRPETVLFDDVDNSGLHRDLHRVIQCSYQINMDQLRRPVLLRLDSQLDDDTYKIFDNIPTYNGQNQSSVDHLLSEAMSTNNETVVTRRPPPLSHPASNNQCEQVARAIIEFAQFWMNFVMERCERGRGLRPRWASQGLEFLMLACDPQNTKHLSQTEFEVLKREMDGCISHVVGVRPSPRALPPASPSIKPRVRKYSPAPRRGRVEVSSEVPPPPTPPSLPDPLLDFTLHPTTEHSSRVMSAISSLERQVHERNRAAGRVGRLVHGPTTHEGPLTRVNFKWLRGLRIGAGTFGKVYTVVNVDSGQLLAMKEISVSAGDRRALQRAARELTILEGVIHPHLVRHYGCELHREEMLIFMELCVEGSLEEMVVSAGALPEVQVRRYSRQLLSAVVELHHRKIAHRDIKSGNIFLMNEGNCLKLGDFGCAVKIRENHTAVGELMGYVGTQAYMAPEVFMKNTGHGRAADIWSLGCVVSEMATGKRPFAEYDSNYQIMFKVGSGSRPEIPSTLSDEGADFTRTCLTHEPDLRPKADDLMMHHFVRQLKEDCNCQPGYLISK